MIKKAKLSGYCFYVSTSIQEDFQICISVPLRNIQTLRINNSIPAGIYLLKVNSRNTRTTCEICSELTIKTPERRDRRRSGGFIVNFEHISHLVLLFLLLTLNRKSYSQA